MSSNNQHSQLAKFLQDSDVNHRSFRGSGVNYFNRFCLLDETLNKNIHKNVNAGAAVSDGVLLTDHGEEHIATVIRQAGNLTCGEHCQLTPYEAYILLAAIHLHDVGNSSGREGHEKKIGEIIFGLEHSVIGNDPIEKRLIEDIAMAHGGTTESGDKDTISQLPYQTRDNTNEPRARMLAGILRLADELSDDHTRTSRFMRENGTVPEESRIYHDYAASLVRVDVNPKESHISLEFDLTVDKITKKYLKGDQEVFLFDEIKNRLLKMQREVIYCNRFILPVAHISSIKVKINLLNQKFKVTKSYAYIIYEKGYPDVPLNFNDSCPDLEKANGESILAEAENKLSEVTTAPSHTRKQTKNILSTVIICIGDLFKRIW